MRLAKFQIISNQNIPNLTYLCPLESSVNDIFIVPFKNKYIGAILIYFTDKIDFKVGKDGIKTVFKKIDKVSSKFLLRIKLFAKHLNFPIGVFFNEVFKQGSNPTKTLQEKQFINNNLPQINLNKEQNNILYKLLDLKKALLLASPGFGKTTILVKIAMINLSKGFSTLIILPEISMIEMLTLG